MKRFFLLPLARRLASASSALLLVALAPAGLIAQSPGSADPAFSSDFNTEGQVIQTEPTAGGKILVLGSFPNQPTVTTFRRLNADGTLDPSFQIIALPIPGDGTAFEQQADGKIVYVGSGANGVAQAAVGRLNADGTADPTFAAGTFQQPFGSRAFYAVAVQPDGQILLGGGFQEYNGFVRPGLTRLNADGTVDEAFIPPNDENLTFSRAQAVAVQADGKVLAAGYATFAGNSVAGIVRLNADGTQDTGFIPQSVDQLLSSSKTAIVVQPDGRILFAGNFNKIGSSFQSDLARLLPVGSLDPSFTPLLTAPVAAVALQGDGKILIGGYFVNVSSATRHNVARLNANGGLDLTFDPGTGAGGGFVQTVALQADGKVLVGGGFGGFGTASRDNLARLLNDFGGATPPPPAGGGSLAVPGTANPYLAGQPAGVTASGGADAAPAESPVLVPGLALNSDRPLNFSVGGSVSNDPAVPATAGPDGGAFFKHDAENGLNAIVAPLNSLVGVFLDDTTPLVGAQPGGTFDYSDPAVSEGGTGLTGTRPRLNQVFFIGDGKDAAGNVQQFYPPQGATRLFLAVMDGNNFADNLGALNVGVTTGTLDASDLRLSQDVSTPTAANGSYALIGDSITYTFHLKNESAAPIANVAVTDILPPYTTFVSASDGGTLQGGIVTWKLGSVAPTGAGASRDLTLVVKTSAADQPSVKGAFINTELLNAAYFAKGDFYPSQQGLDRQNVTTLKAPVDIAIASNAKSVTPGGIINYTIDLRNITGAKVKKPVFTLALPAGVKFLDAYAVDVNGVRLAAKPGDFTLNGGQLAIFSPGNLTPGQAVHLVLSVQVPYDVLADASINFLSGQLATKTSDENGQNFYGVSIPDTQLSGIAPSSTPELSLLKFVPDPITIVQAVTLEGAAAPLVGAVLQAAFPGVKDGKGLDKLAKKINPDVSTSVDAAGNVTQAVTDPGAQITFALVYRNLGTAKVKNAVLQDRVPAGTKYVNGSAQINGVDVTADQFSKADGGQTLLFNLGTIKDSRPDKPSFGIITYAVKLLNPSSGGPAVGSTIRATGGALNTPSLFHTTLAFPGEIDVAYAAPAHIFTQVTQTNATPGFANPNSPATPANSHLIYDITYKNDGGVNGADVLIVDTLPPGVVNGKGSFVKGAVGRVDAATNGQIVFHLGALPMKAAGIVRVEADLTKAAAQAQASLALVNSARGLEAANFVPARQQGAVTRQEGRGGVPRLTQLDLLGGGDAAVAIIGGPGLPKLFAAVTAPLSVQEGETYDVLIAVGNPTDYVFIAGVAVEAYIPDNAEFVSADQDSAFVSTSHGYKTVTFANQDKAGRVQGIAPHSSLVHRLTLRAPQGTGGQLFKLADVTALAAQSVIVGSGEIFPPTAAVHSGELATFVYPADQPFGNAKRQILSAALAEQGVTVANFVDRPDFQAKLDALDYLAVGVRTGGADCIQFTNNTVLIPLLGGNVLALGAPKGIKVPNAAVLSASSQGGFVVSNDGGSIVATGGGNLINLTNLISQDGGGLVNATGVPFSSVLSGLISQDGGGLIAQGAGNIVATGGGNLISQDGGGLISQDGGGLISQDGGSLGTLIDNVTGLSGVQKAAALISQDGGGVIGTSLAQLISQDGGGVISNDGGSFVVGASGSILATQGGKLIATGGGNVVSNDGGSFRGSSSASAALTLSLNGFMATSGGNIAAPDR